MTYCGIRNYFSLKTLSVNNLGGKLLSKVIFIGNSHTYYESLPWVFADVCAQAGKDVSVTMCTHPECDWAWHLQSPNTLSNLRFGEHDYAVLQQVAHPFDASSRFFEQGDALISEVRKAKAKPVLYVPWSERNNPDGQKTIDDYHLELELRHPDVLSAWCGKAWHKLRDVLNLYDMDGEHQNSLGAYLNACVLSAAIFSINPLSLPENIHSKALTEDIHPHEKRLLQAAAAGSNIHITAYNTIPRV